MTCSFERTRPRSNSQNRYWNYWTLWIQVPPKKIQIAPKLYPKTVHSEQRILGSIGEWYFEYYFVTRVEKNLLRQPSEDSSKNIDPGPKTFNDKTPMDPTFFGVPAVSHKKIPHDFVDFRQHSSAHGFVSRWKIKTPRLFSSKNQAAWKSPAPDSTEAKSFRKKKNSKFLPLRDP